MAKYRMTKEVNAEKFDGTMESCERILKLIGSDSDEYSTHVYGNGRKTASFKHKQSDKDFKVEEWDYVVVVECGEWGIIWYVDFDEAYVRVEG